MPTSTLSVEQRFKKESFQKSKILSSRFVLGSGFWGGCDVGCDLGLNGICYSEVILASSGGYYFDV